MKHHSKQLVQCCKGTTWFCYDAVPFSSEKFTDMTGKDIIYNYNAFYEFEPIFQEDILINRYKTVFAMQVVCINIKSTQGANRHRNCINQLGRTNRELFEDNMIFLRLITKYFTCSTIANLLESQSSHRISPVPRYSKSKAV